MKPDWDRLMADFAGSETQLVADVDCTAEGEPLCQEHGIQGFPTLKWGDPTNLDEYQGGRDYDSLKAFADENLKPMCSPLNLDLCDDEKKAEIEKFQAMKTEDLKAKIETEEAKLAKLDEDFEVFVEGLQNQFEEAMAKKDADANAIKAQGLGLMKAVLATSSMDKKDEL